MQSPTHWGYAPGNNSMLRKLCRIGYRIDTRIDLIPGNTACITTISLLSCQYCRLCQIGAGIQELARILRHAFYSYFEM